MARPVLQLGSRGDEVRQLQELLRGRGYRILADGYFGPATYGAVLNFQLSHRLTADGVVRAGTWAALGRQDRSQPSAGRADWTFMVYMAGNNSLSAAAGRDLQEIRSVAALNDVRVTAFVKRRDAQGRAQHLEITPGGAGDVVVDLGVTDSGRAQTVVDFVRWSIDRAPAQRYALVIWNHGGGWEPTDLFELYSQVRGRPVRRDTDPVRRVRGDEEATEAEIVRLIETEEVKKALFAEPLQGLLSLPTSSQRAIASDDGTLHSLDTIEVKNILARIHQDLGRPLDLLGMDACLMSNLEVAYEIREHVGVVVGSEETEPFDGWPYEKVLTALAADSAMDARRLGKLIVDEYIESYRDTSETVTQCAIDATRIEEFMREFEAFASGLRRQVGANRAVVDSVQSVAKRFHVDKSLMDLRMLCLALVADTRTDATLASVADKLLAVQNPGGFIVHEDRLGARVAECGGVSVYFPTEPVISKYYPDLQFAKDTDWDEFLTAYGTARTINGRRTRRA